MALQSCRPSLARCRHASRIFMPCLRSYSSPSTTGGTATSPPVAGAAPEPTQEAFAMPSSAPATGESSRAPMPRWKATPVGMKAPMQMDFAKKARNKVWSVNNSPERLDEMYNKLLGPGGSRMLPDELKWLAVTHKSFDQGRRGFNDRLALMGRLTMVMEATKEIVSRSPIEGSILPDEFEREPLSNEQLRSVDNLNVQGPKDIVGKEKLYALAQKVEMLDVLRWKPRLPDRLESSGVEAVMNGAIMAIIGAVTLQHGSVVAAKVVRERILTQIPKTD